MSVSNGFSKYYMLRINNDINTHSPTDAKQYVKKRM